MKRVLYIDFDETLFNHELFIQWISGQVSEKLHIDVSRYVNSFDEYHKAIDTIHRLYDHESHISETLGLSWDEFLELAHTAVNQYRPDLLYSGADQLVYDAIRSDEFDTVAILTYGDNTYQRFKIGLCDQIKHVEVVVVDVPKREYLLKQTDEHGVLVDDKGPLHLPRNFKHAWVDRSNPKIKPTENDYDVHMGDRLDFGLLL